MRAPVRARRDGAAGTAPRGAIIPPAARSAGRGARPGSAGAADAASAASTTTTATAPNVTGSYGPTP